MHSLAFASNFPLNWDFTVFLGKLWLWDANALVHLASSAPCGTAGFSGGSVCLAVTRWRVASAGLSPHSGRGAKLHWGAKRSCRTSSSLRSRRRAAAANAGTQRTIRTAGPVTPAGPRPRRRTWRKPFGEGLTPGLRGLMVRKGSTRHGKDKPVHVKNCGWCLF